MTGWGSRWLERIGQVGLAFADRLARGGYYSSRGAVRRLELAPGRVVATVQHGRHRPQQVTIMVPSLTDDGLDELTTALAREVRFTAALLEGDLPLDVGDLLAGTAADPLPPSDQVTATCRCGETAPPCLHVAAVHHRVAQELDADPLRLVELRGRDRRTLLAAVQGRRSGSQGTATRRSTDAQPLADLDPDRDPFAARGDLDAIALHPQLAEDPAWLLEHLGPPPGVDDLRPLARLLTGAAEVAWRLAAGEGSEVADDELLLAELRAQGTATAATVGTALGWDAERTREHLDRLYEDGHVLRTGAGERSRYRAAASTSAATASGTSTSRDRRYSPRPLA